MPRGQSTPKATDPARGRSWSDHLWTLAQRAASGILNQVAEGGNMTAVEKDFALAVLRAAVPDKDLQAPAPRPVGRPRKPDPEPELPVKDPAAELWKDLRAAVLPEKEQGKPDPEPKPEAEEAEEAEADESENEDEEEE